jgi:hypothetical protein
MDLRGLQTLEAQMYGRTELSWCKINEVWTLYCEGRREPMLHVVPDDRYAGMWRIHQLDGRLSDMINLTRARDGGAVTALRMLNGEKQAVSGAPMRETVVPATPLAGSPIAFPWPPSVMIAAGAIRFTGHGRMTADAVIFLA